MDVVRLLHRSVYVLVYTRPFGAAVSAGMKLLQELGRGRGGLAASAPCGGAKDAVTSVGVVSPVRRRLARKTSVEEAGAVFANSVWRSISSEATLDTKDQCGRGAAAGFGKSVTAKSLVAGAGSQSATTGRRYFRETA